MKDAQIIGIGKAQEKQIKELQGIVQQQQAQIQQIYEAYKNSQDQLTQYRTTEYRRAHITQCTDFAINFLTGMDATFEMIQGTAKKFHQAIEDESRRMVEEDRAAFEAKQAEAKAKEEAEKEIKSEGSEEALPETKE